MTKKKKGLMKRCSKRCDQCLFSDNKIVSDERKDDLIEICHRDNTHFVCHKFSAIDGQDVACRGWLDTYPFVSQSERIAHALVRDSEDYQPYEDVEPPKGALMELLENIKS